LLDTLAAAYAEAGNFKDAIAYQKKAIAIAGDTADEGYQQRLALYRSGQPFRNPAK
jgi:hypothetical protein